MFLICKGERDISIPCQEDFRKINFQIVSQFADYYSFIKNANPAVDFNMSNQAEWIMERFIRGR